MTDFHAELQKLRRNTDKLLAQLKRLKSENQALSEENERLHGEKKDASKKIGDLENKNINLQLSKTLEGGRSVDAALRQRLDELIKEIDDCITHLKD
jgi:predicted nuclease with TOPRIM domain